MARVRSDISVLARPHGKHKGPPRPWGFLIGSFLFLALIGTAIAARITFALLPPHAVLPSSAVLSKDKLQDLSDTLDIERPLDRDQAISFALGYTGQSLSFSLDHPTQTDFGVAKRGANGAEFAALFIAVFEASCKRAGSTARATRVRSPARVFDKVIPVKAFTDHDWVLVYDPADGARIYLDPVLSDLWLGATLARNVKGGEAIPPPPEPAKP